MLALTIAACMAVYARTAFSPLQEATQSALALSDNQMGLLQGPALALPLVIGAIPLGFAIDRYRRARLLFIFAAVTVVGSVATAFATSAASLFVARFLIGLAAPVTVLAVFSMVADLYAPAQRGRALTVVSLGQIAGTAAAFTLGGALLATFGSEPYAWRYAMVGLTAPLVLVLLLLAAVREPLRTGVIVKNPSVSQAFGELWRFRAIIAPLLVGGIMVGMADAAVMIWAAPTFSRSFGLPPDRIGTIMGGVVLAGGLMGSFLGGPIADLCQRKGGPRRTMSALAVLTLSSVPAGLFAVIPGVAAASVLLAIFLAMGIAISVMIGTLITVVIPNEVRALCMAVSGALSVPLIVGAAPVTVSLLSGAIGGSSMIGTALAVVCVTTSAFGAVIFAATSRYLARSGAVNAFPE